MVQIATGQMAGVFLCYSRRDIDLARAVQQAVEGAGFRCWRDEKWLLAGSDFAEEITRAIRDSLAFVLLLSHESAGSDFVAIEVALARHFGVPIVPAYVSKVEIPPRLLPDLVRLHTIGPTVPEVLLREIVDAVRHRVPAAVTRESQELRPSAAGGEPRLVSNGEYQQFVMETRCPLPPHWNRRAPYYDPAQESAPVCRVSWDDAVSYCDWVGAELPALNGGLDGGRTTDDSILASRRAEWLDGGLEHHKYAQLVGDGPLIGLLPRAASRDGLGFRALPVRPYQPTVAFLDEAAVAIGPDPRVFGEIATGYRLPRSTLVSITARARQRLHVGGFRIAVAPVTNGEYWDFHRRTGCRWPTAWKGFAPWIAQRHGTPFPPRLAAHPVTGVSIADVQRFCGLVSGRLPTSDEWERAAAGREERRYPWGDVYDWRRINSYESMFGGTTRADAFECGASPERLRQLSGNVFELVLGPEGRPEVRGGSWRVPCEVWGMSWVFRRLNSDAGENDLGFRVVYD